MTMLNAQSGLRPRTNSADGRNTAEPRRRLLPVDIGPFRKGNAGVDYVHRIPSGRSGPTVMINALTHGNELCGAHAIAQLFAKGIRPLVGTLILSFSNVAAYASYDDRAPLSARFVEEDFNRIWSDDTLDSDRSSVELDRARKLRQIVSETDYLLDIHSMSQPGPPLMLCGWPDKGRQLARALGTPHYVVADRGHKSGVRMRDYGPFADPRSRSTALLIECGEHTTPESAEIALDTSLAFLRTLGLIDKTGRADAAAGVHDSGTPGQTIVEVTEAVTVTSAQFSFVGEANAMDVVDKAGTVIARDGTNDVKTPYENCVLVMPGRQLSPGQTAVRLGRFIASPDRPSMKPLA